MIAKSMAGFTYLFVGWKTLTRKENALIKWALIPLAINIGLFILGLYWATTYIPVWVEKGIGFIVTADSGFLYNLLYYPLLIFLWLAFVVVDIFVVYAAGIIIASPFNALLAEKTLMKLGVIEDREFNFSRWVKTSIKMLITSVIKAVLFLILGVLLFILSFIPGLNFVSSYAAFMILAFDSFDYSFEILELSLRQRIGVFRRLLPEFIGMGGILGLTALLPGLTLLVQPIAVVGAAQLLERAKKKGRISHGSNS